MTSLPQTTPTHRYFSAATLLTLLLGSSIFLVTIVNILLSSWQQNASNRAIMLDEAKAVGLLAASGSTNGVIFNQRDLLERAASGVESLSGFEWIIIRNSLGDTLYTKNFALAPTTFQQGASLMPQNSVRTLEQENGIVIVAAPVQGPVETERRGEVLLALNRREMENAINRSRMAMILGSLGAALLLVLIGFIIMRILATSSKKHVEIAQRVTKGDLTLRINENFSIFTPAENVITLRAFNKMLDSLEQSYEEMSIKNERLQDATIELRQLNQTATERAREIEMRNLEMVKINTQLDSRTKELEEKNRQVEEQNELLQALNTEKNEFLGIVAHDLKNPLSGLRGLANVLEESSPSPNTIKEIARIMVQSTDRMFELVRNLLDVNQLERGGRKYELLPVNVAWTLMPVVESYLGRAEEKAILLEFTPPEETIICFTDALAFSQVMDNLVSNAVKYSPHNSHVWVEAVSTPHAVRIAVRDEGPGLSDEDKSRLFGKFARLSAQPTGGEHSTGLGLSIVKKMVESLHGKVWCESELGKGATFFVEFPRTAVETAA